MEHPITIGGIKNNPVGQDAANSPNSQPRSLSTEEHRAPPAALTVSEASELLRLDPRTIRAMVHSGELDGNQRGHAIRVSRSSVLDWLRGKRRVSRSKR